MARVVTEFDIIEDKTRFIGRQARINFLMSPYHGAHVIIVDTYDEDDTSEPENIFWCMLANGKEFMMGEKKRAFHCEYLKLLPPEREWDEF